MDYSLPVCSIQGILQARILEWIATPSSKGSSRPRDRTCISCNSCIAGRFFTTELPGKPLHIHTHTYIHTLGKSTLLNICIVNVLSQAISVAFFIFLKMSSEEEKLVLMKSSLSTFSIMVHVIVSYLGNLCLPQVKRLYPMISSRIL